MSSSGSMRRSAVSPSPSSFSWPLVRGPRVCRSDGLGERGLGVVCGGGRLPCAGRWAGGGPRVEGRAFLGRERSWPSRAGMAILVCVRPCWPRVPGDALLVGRDEGPRAEWAGLAVSWREASCLGPVVDGPWTRWGRSPVGCPCVLWASPCAGTVVSACGDGRGLRTVHGFPALGCAISGLCRLCGHLGEFVSWGGLAVLLSWPLWGLAELVVR